MHDQVKAVLDRSDQVRGGEGAINDTHGTHLLSGGADGIQVDYFDEWIREGFHVENVWLFCTDEISNVWAAQIMQDHLDAHGYEDFAQQCNGCAVEVLRCQNLAPRCQAAQDLYGTTITLLRKVFI